MVTKDKLLKEINTPYKNKEKIEKLLLKLLKSPSSWTTIGMNKKLWMRNAVFIGRVSTWPKNWAFSKKEGRKKQFWPALFSGLGAQAMS